MGLGFVLSFGYWCTDFLVVQRAMAAKSMNAARRTPLVAAVPKMFFPFLVILPGMVVLALVGDAGLADAAGKADYNLALPLLLQKLYPPGLLGLGLTALLASFMSGMAGNVTAFNTVWTYDIYQTVHPPGRRRRALPVDGADGDGLRHAWRASATAYIAMMFNNIMDLLQLVFSFINAPLFATFLLGMFWKRDGERRVLGTAGRDRRGGGALRADRRRGRAARGCCTRTRATWRRTSGAPSSRGRPVSCSRLRSAS